MTTIRDVAAHANVSPATVSRVINGSNEVNPSLAARVWDSVAVLDYRPSRLARSLRSQRSLVWGLIISDIRNPFFTDMARGVEDAAADMGYSVVLCNADEDTAKEQRYIELILDERMAGCIITPAHLVDSSVQPLLDADIPVVAVDREISGTATDLVRLDNREAAAHATRHLLEQGYVRVACISGPKSTTTGTDRAAGYLEALEGREALLQYADFRVEGGYRAAQSLLRRAEPPDAIVVGNNLMTIGALRAISDTGRSTRDFGLISFDELAWADLVDPALSTIGQPTYEIGKAAAGLLMKRIQGLTTPPEILTLESEMHVRESSIRRHRS